MSIQPDKIRIFISHAWEDKPLVHKIERELTNTGVEVWVDHSGIRGGDNLPKRINDALKWCNNLLLIWSTSASKSRWVELEWTNAISLNKRIIPCVVDDTELPAILTNKLFINFQDPEAAISQLLFALKILKKTKLNKPKRSEVHVPHSRFNMSPDVVKPETLHIAEASQDRNHKTSEPKANQYKDYAKTKLEDKENSLRIIEQTEEHKQESDKTLKLNSPKYLYSKRRRRFPNIYLLVIFAMIILTVIVTLIQYVSNESQSHFSSLEKPVSIKENLSRLQAFGINRPIIMHKNSKGEWSGILKILLVSNASKYSPLYDKSRFFIKMDNLQTFLRPSTEKPYLEAKINFGNQQIPTQSIYFYDSRQLYEISHKYYVTFEYSKGSQTTNSRNPSLQGKAREELIKHDQKNLNLRRLEIAKAFQSKRWEEVDRLLKLLYENESFYYYDLILPEKNQVIKNYEDSLFKSVQQEIQKRVDAIINHDKIMIDDVDNIYNDLFAIPVYELKFAIDSREVLRRNKAIQDFLGYKKYYYFPEISIKEIYKNFSLNPHDNGIVKARAIVIHGGYYKGRNEAIRNLVRLCNPYSAKLITKKDKFYKFYVLPNNDIQQSLNNYIFRIQFQPVSGIDFRPVYKLSLKVPREVTKKDKKHLWYEDVIYNDESIKAKGWYYILSPNKENNYICEIGPLLVENNKGDILEIHFEHNAFKVLEFSVKADVILTE